MRVLARHLIRKMLHSAGYDIARLSQFPEHTFLGLRNLPIRSVIDVGANTGQFARRALEAFPEARIYAFEPLPEPFEDLKQWARGKRKVWVFNVALGDDAGRLDMFHCVDFSPSSSFLRSTELHRNLYPKTTEQELVPVEVCRLDSFLAELSEPILPDILIKLDVQGYEDRVILGAKDTLRRATACILEVNLEPLYEGQPSFKELLDLLDELGHRYAGNLDQVYATDGHALFVDALFVNRNA